MSQRGGGLGQQVNPDRYPGGGSRLYVLNSLMEKFSVASLSLQLAIFAERFRILVVETGNPVG